MKDSFDRKIDYMRISVTDRCNLRCRYCMPEGTEKVPMREILSYEEMLLAAEAAASLGISRFKVTGGEPLVRKGVTGFLADLKKVPGVSEVTLTTNGTLLMSNLSEIKAAGVSGINISLDTMKPERFKEITGTEGLRDVLDGIQAALDSNIPIKINTVLLEGVNQDEWRDIIGFAERYPVAVRFIEMMPIGYGRDFSPVKNSDILKEIEALYPGSAEDTGVRGNGPAVYIKPPGFLGSIGFISPVSSPFCSSCNRIRLTSMGKIKPCLCYGDTVDLKPILREKEGEERRALLREAIEKAIRLKPEAHCFDKKEGVTEGSKMVSIGG